MGLVKSLFRFIPETEESNPEVLETKEETGIPKDTKSEEKTGNDAALSPVQNGLPGTNENPGSTWESQSPVQEIKDADRINVIVKFRGKKMTVDVFPLEKISVLKRHACQVAGVKEENFQLVYEGQIMEETGTVNEYNLRGGKEVHLIYRN